LEADLIEAVAWADEQPRRWAFTLSNAGARYAEFRNSLDDLDDIDWDAVGNTDFRSPEVKEGKQAEFLIYESFPLSLVNRIGVYSETVGEQAAATVADTPAAPPVDVRRDWYF